jgi:23S rRNA pseudouridine1911/1915/1917 synthase
MPKNNAAAQACPDAEESAAQDVIEVCCTVPEEVCGERIDSALVRLLSSAASQRHPLDWSRSHIKRALLSLTLNGRQAKLSDHVQTHSKLCVTLLDQPSLLEAKAEDIPLDVIHEDDDIIVINKPQGMAVHPSAGTPRGTVANALLAHCRIACSEGAPLRPGIVHRLDKDTSGLLVCVKSEAAQYALGKAFHDRKVHKIYSAIVRGRMTPRQGMIDAPLARDPVKRTRQAVVPNGRSAQTGYKVLEEFEKYSRLEITLYTGRTHQIRAHLSHIERPILGDPIYSRSDALCATLCLAAVELGFAHPVTGKDVCFSIPPPAHMQAVLESLRTKEERAGK